MTKPMTWVVCGAGRGVGKTHLAQALCEVLPRSLYAKRGCGERRADGPENFFRTAEDLEAFLASHRATHKHLVVESNECAREGKGDIVVFIDGVPDKTDVREDVERLRAKADLQVSSEASIRDWKTVLRKKITDNVLREAVCDVLIGQKRHLFKGKPRVKVKVWLDDGGMHIFGAGLARLLEHVERSGTLRDAAVAAGMSYRHAWGLLRNAEKHHGEPLVRLQPGGVGGGQAALSRHGRYLLATYQRVCGEIDAVAERCLDRGDPQ